MRRMQSTSKKATIVGLRSMPMRVGVAERRGAARESYCVPRADKKVCLRINVSPLSFFSASWFCSETALACMWAMFRAPDTKELTGRRRSHR